MPINPSKLLSDHFNPTQSNIVAAMTLPQEPVNLIGLENMENVNKDLDNPLQNTVNLRKHADCKY